MLAALCFQLVCINESFLIKSWKNICKLSLSLRHRDLSRQDSNLEDLEKLLHLGISLIAVKRDKMILLRIPQHWVFCCLNCFKFILFFLKAQLLGK